MRFKCKVLHVVPQCFLVITILYIKIPSFLSHYLTLLQLEVSSSNVPTKALDNLHVLAESLAVFTYS